MYRCLHCRKPCASAPICSDCRLHVAAWPKHRRIDYLDDAVILLPYDGGWKRAMRAMKFEGKEGYLRDIAALMAPEVEALSPEALVPIPADPIRAWFRGWDPSARLAKAIGDRVGLEVLALLKRQKHTAAQHALPGYRRRTSELCFGVQKKPPKRRLVLIDDILTTGRTLSEAARLLRFADPNVSVSAVVFLG